MSCLLKNGLYQIEWELFIKHVTSVKILKSIKTNIKLTSTKNEHYHKIYSFS